MSLKLQHPVDLLKVNIPEGECGVWSVRKFTVTEEDAQHQRIREMLTGFSTYTPPGTYTGLYKDGIQVMSDVPMDIIDHLEFLRMATGRILLNGLGLGVVLRQLLRKKDVKRIDVVEKSSDVLTLVSPHLEDPRVSFHHGNALSYRFPVGVKWDVVWHDIWDHISESNLEDMDVLKRRFSHRCKWQGCWGQERCKYHKRLWA